MLDKYGRGESLLRWVIMDEEPAAEPLGAMLAQMTKGPSASACRHGPQGMRPRVEVEFLFGLLLSDLLLAWKDF